MVSNKKLMIILLFVCSAGHAQNADEIFSQKKTLIKYLTQQVAALQVYMSYAQKGYAVAKDGLNLIGDIKKGDFNLHSSYFNSLQKINPGVATYSKIAGIISCNVKLVNSYKTFFKKMKLSGQFTDKEINYIHTVFNKVLDDAAQVVDEVTLLITPNEYDMKDDERLRRIDVLYDDMQDKQTFIQHFSNESYVLSVLRKKEKQEVEMSRSLNNIK
jgi:hypothetical protein